MRGTVGELTQMDLSGSNKKRELNRMISAGGAEIPPPTFIRLKRTDGRYASSVLQRKEKVDESKPGLIQTLRSSND